MVLNGDRARKIRGGEERFAIFFKVHTLRTSRVPASRPPLSSRDSPRQFRDEFRGERNFSATAGNSRGILNSRERRRIPASRSPLPPEPRNLGVRNRTPRRGMRRGKARCARSIIIHPAHYPSTGTIDEPTPGFARR